MKSRASGLTIFALWAVYIALASALYWSANQQPNTLASSVFIICLFGSWVPAFLFTNRHSIAGNKTFWLSQTAGFSAAVLTYIFISPIMEGIQEPIENTIEGSSSWFPFVISFGLWLLVAEIGDSVVRRAFGSAEAAVENKAAAEMRSKK